MKLKVTALFLFSIAAFNFAGCTRKPPPVNVILIIIDTLRKDHVSCYGYERETTPNLDELAREGVRFENAKAPSPWTLPSIASMLTGQNPSNHMAGIHLDPPDMEDRRLTMMHESILTIAQIFQQKGYSTVGFFQNPFVDPSFGLDRGFDVYNYRPGDNLNIRRANSVVDAAVQWLEQRGRTRQGFLMVVHLFDPHLAYDPAINFVATYTYGYKGKLRPPFAPDLKEIRSGRMELSEADKQFAIGLYDGEIATVDNSLGSFFDYLKEKGVYDSSMIIAASDHGEEFWDHDSFEHGHTMHWELLDVPLIIRFPGGLHAGKVITEGVSLTDLFPSILGFLDWSVPIRMDGVSFIPGPSTLTVRPHILFSENVHFGPQQQAFIVNNYKMTINEHGRIEVYNLEKDPLETENIFGLEKEFPKEIHEQIDFMAGQMKKLIEEKSPQAADLDRETKKKLKALGYLQ